MKILHVKKLDTPGKPDLDRAAQLIEQHAVSQPLETVNWPSFSYQPEVKFSIAHCKEHILLKFQVNEENIKALETRVNGDVYKDSCVEFFLSPGRDNNYYNFEFNCIGTTHLAYGNRSDDRELIDPSIIDMIQVRTSLGTLPIHPGNSENYWEILLVIPSDCLIHHKGIPLSGIKATANFYKCGDNTKIPHYLSWNPIDTETPNFHQPTFFGALLFD